MKDLIQWRWHAYLNKYNRHSLYGNAIHMLSCAAGSKQSVLCRSRMTDGKRGRSAAHRRSQGEKLEKIPKAGAQGRTGFNQIHFKNGWFVQMTRETMSSTPKPHQKIDVYVQYSCSPPYSTHPSPQPHSILKLFCYVVGIISYDRSLARVCALLWGLRLQARHIISAKYSILAGTLQI